MRDHVASATASKMGVLRALHQTLDLPPIFVDPLAARVLGRDAEALLREAARDAAGSARLRATLAVRSRFAEDAVAEATARGVRQYAILGAGLDTFAYRQTDRATRVFELDHPATQAWKRQCLREAAIAEPPSVRFVPADLAVDPWPDALVEAGFDPSRPAIVVVLGVLAYLERDVVARVLCDVATLSAAGSALIFDYTEPFDGAADPVRAPYVAAASRVAAVGEPWKSLFEPADLRAMVTSAGFARVTDLDAAALDARFCAGRSDGLRVAPLLHLVRAEV